MIKRKYRLAGVAALASAALAVSACSSASGGSSSPSSSTATGSAAAAAIPVTPTIKVQLPAAISSSGQITDAQSGALSPDTFLDANGNLTGVLPDLLNAMAQTIGLKMSYQKVTYAGIVTGLEANRFETAVFFTDTKAAEPTENFVDLTSEGNSWLVASSFTGTTTEDLCGKAVGAGAGSSELASLPAMSQQCVSEGKPAMAIHAYPTNPAASIAVESGRITAVLGATEVGGYETKNSGGKLKLIPGYVGARFNEGLITQKTADGLLLAKALDQACTAMIKSGEYLAILKKWGVVGVALPGNTCPMNVPSS